MPKFVMDDAVVRFLTAAVELDGAAWADVDARRMAEVRTGDGDLLKRVEGSVSASERSAIEKHVRAEMRDTAAAAAAGGQVRSSRVMVLARVSSFALQKRDALAEEDVRSWFTLFENVGIRLDDLLEGGR